jgi:alkanesulfonate monooxygenase SsuD/methylene tetrahydromethanopterin reductase-like flavin-dependent oxidoreductase (luciferase family)
VYLPIEGAFADIGLLAALAGDAETAGWDGFFLWDELLPIYEHFDQVRDALGDSGEVADPTVALTAVAAATARIRFGAMVSPVARRRPEEFAKQTATLDRFSGGRLIVGVGLGNPATQFTAFGRDADLRVRAGMVDEFLEVLTRLWTGDEVDFRGSYYTATGVALRPPPLQRPRIPIWIGADSTRRAPRRRAARWDGFVPASPSWPTGVLTADDYTGITIDIAAQRTSTLPFDLVLIGNDSGTLPAREAVSAYADAGVTWFLVQAFDPESARTRIRRGPP